VYGKVDERQEGMLQMDKIDIDGLKKAFERG
jgi:hypothetical protein